MAFSTTLSPRDGQRCTPWLRFAQQKFPTRGGYFWCTEGRVFAHDSGSTVQTSSFCFVFSTWRSTGLLSFHLNLAISCVQQIGPRSIPRHSIPLLLLLSTLPQMNSPYPKAAPFHKITLAATNPVSSQLTTCLILGHISTGTLRVLLNYPGLREANAHGGFVGLPYLSQTYAGIECGLCETYPVVDEPRRDGLRVTQAPGGSGGYRTGEGRAPDSPGRAAGGRAERTAKVGKSASLVLVLFHPGPPP